LMHALAKANLFIIIGRLLHRSFSQQDARFISSSSVNIFIVLRIIIRLFRLVGVSFIAGYFSKEQILFGQYFLISRGLSWLGLILIRRFTAAYCLKLFLTLRGSSNQNLFQYSFIRLIQFIPVTLLRRLRVSAGLLFSMNLTLTRLLFGRIEGDYWIFAVFGVLLFLITSLFGLGLYGGFYSQLKEIDFFLNKLTSIKALAVKIESSRIETLYLYSRLIAGSIKSRARSLFLLCLVLIFIFIY
jgi:NADH:ubiquinone oxidoreductase subunit 5 (subunit L)/multisubunit Na+/H+ antiporter MnhA subunit